MTDQSLDLHAENSAPASLGLPHSSRPMKRSLSEQETQSAPHQLSRNLPPGSTDYPPAKRRYVPSFRSYADMTDENHTAPSHIISVNQTQTSNTMSRNQTSPLLMVDRIQPPPCHMMEMNHTSSSHIIDRNQTMNGIQTALPCTVNGIQTALPCTVNGIQTALPCTVNGIQTALPCTVNGIQTALPCTVNGIQTALPYIVNGNQTALPYIVNGNQTALPFMVNGNHTAHSHNQPVSRNQKDSPASKPYIKKPLNAFMLYRAEERLKIMEELCITDSAAVNKVVGQRWKSLSKEEQAPYFEKAHKVRREHQAMHPGWSASDNFGKNVRRRKRTVAHFSVEPTYEYGVMTSSNAPCPFPLAPIQSVHQYYAPIY
ncbi:hypothetical protein WMY93_018595 [Mugilogobius chulae]|uniref:HMG box domain-containing protein n=1 Tax=Mugilogobius chulae TaxID=88201 RepID=A0AAW0NRA4_9GOBI